ncbi:MAG: hypothetical protein LC751_06685, partial [Actinobacteria bacterium]|nr:hypothetical protein [Actinomycetota bacterium]
MERRRDRRKNKLNARDILGALLSSRDWIYLLSLLAPFVAYDLSLKALDIASQAETPGLSGTLRLMRSDIFFDLGYASLWVGLFAATRRTFVRWSVIFLFHAATMLVVAVTMLAHLYSQQTGVTLDY